MSKSSAFSISVLLIFEKQLVNGAIFFNAKLLFSLSILFLPSAVIIPLITIYASL